MALWSCASLTLLGRLPNHETNPPSFTFSSFRTNDPVGRPWSSIQIRHSTDRRRLTRCRASASVRLVQEPLGTQTLGLGEAGGARPRCPRLSWRFHYPRMGRPDGRKLCRCEGGQPRYQWRYHPGCSHPFEGGCPFLESQWSCIADWYKRLGREGLS